MKDSNIEEKEKRARKRVNIETDRKIPDWLSCFHINNGQSVNK